LAQAPDLWGLPFPERACLCPDPQSPELRGPYNRSLREIAPTRRGASQRIQPECRQSPGIETPRKNGCGDFRRRVSGHDYGALGHLKSWYVAEKKCLMMFCAVSFVFNYIPASFRGSKIQLLETKPPTCFAFFLRI
jgi:hypothetical protein